VADENPYAPWERNFRQQLQRLRESKGMTQTDVARELRILGLAFHQQTIQRIETGERPVRLNEANLIAKVLGVTVDAMTTGGSPPTQAIRYAVDRLRMGASTTAEQLGEVTEEVVEDLSALLVAIGDRGADLADPFVIWGTTWALAAYDAIVKIIDARSSLAAISGAVTFYDSVALEAVRELRSGRDWTIPSSRDEFNDLYAAFPGDHDDSKA